MFRVGQEVVALKNTDVTRKDQVYTIAAIYGRWCRCRDKRIFLDVSIPSTGLVGYCPKCNEHRFDDGGVLILASELFAPLLTDAQEADFSEAIELSKELVNS